MSSLSFYYIVRRLQPQDSQYYPSCQIVACHTNKEYLEGLLEDLWEKVQVPHGTTYAVEKHGPNMSGRALEEAYALNQKKKMEYSKREEEEIYQERKEKIREEREQRQQLFLQRQAEKARGAKRPNARINFPPPPGLGDQVTAETIR